MRAVTASPTLEYYLARITARAQGLEPSIAPGTKPTLTESDIRAAVSQGSEPLEFHALLAKYCADPWSERELLKMTRTHSGLVFLERYPDYTIRGKVNQAIAESAVLFFVSPILGARRGDVGNAAHAGVGRNTWAKYYRDHFKAVTAWLFEAERRGLLKFRRQLG